ncbi:lysophospholipid acyltransferase family protein [Flavobacterium agrisoli]|uniref:Lysophospholipid acyltransferase family protein n=1 Tax=Flavobacterium agrisoli TaxID=2793066 RepID=A0A934UL16_9FLAO|nr:lysophospholipid acyltransferase family protein [Flavobacterium agrisoli]MBK0371148.1 lysophospholipid acyltransferase family protein [Flavobacterium agrisoli]
MQLLVFIIAFPFLWLISILPFPLFYLFSDCIYVIVYYLIGYRKKTVRQNLALTLPYLSEAERLVIEKKFYRYMCDLFLEMIKTMTMSAKEMRKRFKITNLELIQEYEQKGKSIILFASHYASYEWLLTINTEFSFRGVAVYKGLANRYFDRLVRSIRTKYDTEMLETKDTIRTIAQHQSEPDIFLYGLASDQSPKVSKALLWTDFMGIEVPAHTGAEMLARRYDLPCLFVKVKRVKRGYYEATFETLTDHPKEMEEFEITKKYLKKLEEQIHEQPEFYLWTHKRWKHRKKK